MNTPVKMNPKHKGTKKLFANSILERLSRTHVGIPISMFFLTSLGLLFYALFYSSLRINSIISILFIGLLSFTLIEYIVHRFIFHMPTNSKEKEKIQYTIHGIHHEYPKDKDRLAMPPLMSGAICAILFFILRLSMGSYSYPFLSGFLLGYASYLFIHFAVHAFQPPNNLLKILWHNHAIHHYKDPEKAFGVSSPLWDFVFGTLPRTKQK